MAEHGQPIPVGAVAVPCKRCGAHYLDGGVAAECACICLDCRHWVGFYVACGLSNVPSYGECQAFRKANDE